MIGGQIEFTGTSGNARAAADAHQPFVFAQMLAEAPFHHQHARRRLFNLFEGFAECVFGNIRVVAERHQYLALAFKLLNEVDLEVGASGHFDGVEQSKESGMMMERVVAITEMSAPLEQVLQPQQRADALVEGLFVGDHARSGGKGWKRVEINGLCKADRTDGTDRVYLNELLWIGG